MFISGLPPEGDKRERELAVHLLALGVSARRVYAAVPRSPRLEGLEPLDLQVLVALSLGPASAVGELAEMLDVIPQTVSKSLGRLRSRALVHDAPADDRRQRRHVLTRAGRAAAHRFVATAEKRLRDYDRNS